MEYAAKRKLLIKPAHASGIVKTAILFIAIVTVVLATEKSELNRKSMCDSVDGFITAMKAFQPSASKGDLSSLFTISDRDEDEHPKPVSALAIESCDTIWSDDNSALLFATANPPTVATHSSIGVLFLLVRQRSHWRIADLRRFVAIGKEAEVSAELTAFAGSGRQLGSEGFAPVVTVKESHGGRGYAYQTYASYKPTGSKLKRLGWNSRNGLSYVLSQRCAVLSVQTHGRCPRKRCMTKNIGMLLLAIYLILVGITTLFHVAIGAIVMGVLALVTGILILVGK